jgi:hypothetical protein
LVTGILSGIGRAVAVRQAAQLLDLRLGARNFFSIGPGIRLPLFTGGRIRSNISVQASRRDAALIRYRSAILNALEEVQNALVNYSHEQERRDRLNDAVQHGRRRSTFPPSDTRRGLLISWPCWMRSASCTKTKIGSLKAKSPSSRSSLHSTAHWAADGASVVAGRRGGGYEPQEKAEGERSDHASVIFFVISPSCPPL